MEIFSQKQRKSVVIFKNQSKYQIANNSNVVTNKMVKIETLVTSVSGQFLNSHLSILLEKRCKIFMKWKFSLDDKLTLNLTFHTVHFTTYFTDCKHGKLYISHLGHRESKYYCGKQPLFYYFTRLLLVDIVCEVKVYIFYNIKVFFTVLDKNLIETREDNLISDCDGLKTGWFLGRRTHLLLFYSMQTTKKKILLCDVSSGAFTFNVYDGPGISSDLLKPKRRYFEASTFQCVILLLDINFSNVSSKIPNTCLFLDFTSKSRKFIPKLFVSNETVFGFNTSSFCAEAFCLISMEANLGQQVNITVTSVLFSGEETHNCLKGGFAVSDSSDDHKDPEFQTVCHTFGNKEQSKRFYSSSSSLTLLVYSYKHYSDIKAEGIVSVTECKPVKLCLCKLGTQCFHGGEKPCLKYLKDIAQHTNSTFSFKQQPNEILVSVAVSDGKCVTLQFRRAEEDVANFPDKVTCGLAFTFPEIVRFDLTGVLQPLMIDGKHIKHCISFHKSGNSLEFVNTGNMGGRSFQQKPGVHVNINYGRSSEAQHSENLRVVPVRALITNSWIDLTVQKKIEEEQQEDFSLIVPLLDMGVSRLSQG